jgi:putative redox protein
MDGPEDLGGRNLGPRPMEMLLMGTGGCSVYDVISMLKKSRQKVVDCRVEMDAERADAIPAVFTRINMHFVVIGVGLKENHVKRAVELSAEKYCSASIMLGAAGVEMSHSYEIVEFDPGL